MLCFREDISSNIQIQPMLRLNMYTVASGIAGLHSNTTNVKVKLSKAADRLLCKYDIQIQPMLRLNCSERATNYVGSEIQIQPMLRLNYVFKGFMSILYFKKLDITSFFSIFTRRKPASPCS